MSQITVYYISNYLLRGDLMTNLILTTDENTKYEIIKNLVDSNGNKDRAALKLGCSKRHVNRLIANYKKHGMAAFIHGNRGRKPAHTLSNHLKQLILDLYLGKYSDCNLTHFCELLRMHENISVSVSTVNSILKSAHILSPKAHRSTKKNLKKQLKQLQQNSSSTSEKTQLQSAILDLDEAHPRRPRSTYAGELLQMDASVHLWFGDSKTHLHIAVDDATGNIVGAYFDYQETLNGYYHVLHQVLTNYGIPYEFFTDNRTVFEYKKKAQPSVEKDTFTQFSYACKQLGINIKTSSVPQAKGRVERMFNTLQSRLPIELRLAGVSSIEEANEFLISYLQKFNQQFALPIDSIKSVFDLQPKMEQINLTLAVLSTRKVDNGSCLKYNKQYYLPINSQGNAVYYRKGTEVMVIKAFDNSLYASINNEVYALQVLPDHVPSSKAFDMPKPESKPKKVYIPPMNHPWRLTSFNKHVSTQKHTQKGA